MPIENTQMNLGSLGGVQSIPDMMQKYASVGALEAQQGNTQAETQQKYQQLGANQAAMQRASKARDVFANPPLDENGKMDIGKTYQQLAVQDPDMADKFMAAQSKQILDAGHASYWQGLNQVRQQRQLLSDLDEKNDLTRGSLRSFANDYSDFLRDPNSYLKNNGAQTTLSPDDKLTSNQLQLVAQQADQKFPTLQGQAGQNVLANQNLTVAQAQASGYDVPLQQPSNKMMSLVSRYNAMYNHFNSPDMTVMGKNPGKDLPDTTALFNPETASEAVEKLKDLYSVTGSMANKIKEQRARVEEAKVTGQYFGEDLIPEEIQTLGAKNTAQKQEQIATGEAQKQEQITGTTAMGAPTEQKRHNIAMEGKLPSSIYSILTPEETTNLNKAIDDGLDPHQVNSRTAKNFAALESAEPGRKWASMGASASYTRSPMATNTISLGNSLYPLVDQLKDVYDKMKNGNMPVVNAMKNWSAKQSGDPNVVEFDNRRNDFAFELTRFATQVGAQSDARVQMVTQMLDRAQSPAQFMAATKAAKSFIDARLEAVRQGPSGHGAGVTAAEKVNAPGAAPEGGIIKVTRDVNGNLVIPGQ